MAAAKDGGGPEKPRLQEEAIVARLVSGTSQAPTGLTGFVGLLGRGATAGRWVLYPSLDMSLAIEIAEEDILHSEPLAADQSPFGSLGGTRIFVRKGAQVTTTRTVSRTHAAEEAGDEFDLDTRLGGGAGVPQIICEDIAGTGTTCATCVTCEATCRTCHTCVTCVTCNTCETRCNQATCAATCQTCATQCNQATCHTCATQCNQATCHTCNQATCHTCHPTLCAGTCATCHTCETCVKPCV